MTSSELNHILRRDDGLVKAQRNVQDLRERFLENPETDLTSLRPSVAQSWRRSVQFGLTPASAWQDTIVVPKLDDQLVASAKLPLERLSELAQELGGGLYLCDPEGTLVPVPGASSSQPLLLRGAGTAFVSAREEAIGTNSDGTALELGKSFQTWGAEHYADRYQDACCTSVPIWDPMRQRLRALLSLMVPLEIGMEIDRRSILVMLETAATEIRADLSARMAHTEQALLNAYVRQRRRRGAEAVLAVGSDTIIASNAGLSFLDQNGRAALGAYALEATLTGREIEGEIDLGEQGLVSLQVQPALRGDEIIGAIVSVRFGGSSRPALEMSDAENFGDLVIKGAEMRRALSRASSIVREGETLHVVGEAGVGKLAFARAIGLARGSDVRTVDCTMVKSESIMLRDISEALDAGQFVIVKRAKRVQPTVLRELARLGNASPDGVLVLVSRVDQEGTPELSEIFATRDVIVPPLRRRREDIPKLVKKFIDEIAGSTQVSVDPRLLTAISGAEWPGNATQLRRFLHATVRSARGDRISTADVPDQWRQVLGDGRLSPLQHAELRVIREAMAASDGNKLEAANKLQIGRSTLYRKMDFYRSKGLSVD